MWEFNWGVFWAVFWALLAVIAVCGILLLVAAIIRRLVEGR